MNSQNSQHSKIFRLISKSEKSLKAAKRDIEEGDYDFAVSRAYYSMFHMATALLLTKNLFASKYSGLLSLFSAHFVQTGRIDPSFHRDFHRAFDLRVEGDYSSEFSVSRQEAQELCQKAEA